jgi:hypothetical protein
VRHDEIAAGCLGGGRADGILEVGPGKGEGALENRLIDGRDSEDRKEISYSAAGGGGAFRPGQEIEQGRDAVGRQETRMGGRSSSPFEAAFDTRARNCSTRRDSEMPHRAAYLLCVREAP